MTLGVEVAFRRNAQTQPLTVAFEAPPGFTVLVGPSGAGKSTTLALIAGLLKPASGRVAVGDQVWFDGAAGVDVLPEARQVGVVFQSLALFPHLSALDNVAFGARGADRNTRRAAAWAWLERCEVSHVAGRRPSHLSGGEAQRVALARALASEPRVLLLDEPFSALDADLREGLRKTVAARVREANIPAVLVTHDREDARALADRVVTLRDGRVVR